LLSWEPTSKYCESGSVSSEVKISKFSLLLLWLKQLLLLRLLLLALRLLHLDQLQLLWLLDLLPKHPTAPPRERRYDFSILTLWVLEENVDFHLYLSVARMVPVAHCRNLTEEILAQASSCIDPAQDSFLLCDDNDNVRRIM